MSGPLASVEGDWRKRGNDTREKRRDKARDIREDGWMGTTNLRLWRMRRRIREHVTAYGSRKSNRE
jgi:hypothetical protein